MSTIEWMANDMAFRVAAQYLILKALRTRIMEERYDPRGMPNIQSAMDVMLLPMPTLRKQLENSPFYPSESMLQKVKSEWDRPFDGTRFLTGQHLPDVEGQ